MKQIIETIIKFANKYADKTARHESYLGGL